MTCAMLFDPVGHVDEEALALYCGQRLSHEDEEAVREHLQVCGECQDRAETEAQFRANVVENRDVLEAPGERASEKRGRLFSLDRWTLWRPVVGWAAVALVAVLLGNWRPGGSASKPLGEPVPVMLEAMRSQSSGKAPTGRPILLQMDLTGLPARESLRVELVGPAGEPLASGVPSITESQALFTIGKPLGAGQYWVRLQKGQAPLREYSLVVQ